MWAYVIVGLIVVFSFDWYYLFHSYWTILWGLLRSPKSLRSTFSIRLIASSLNTDTTFDHLNNAKYLMYMDFARIDLWCRSRLFYYLWQNKTMPLQSATIIRYMKPIRIFTPVRIDTKIVWWDETMVYLEHIFVVRAPTERIVCISMSRVCFERRNIDLIFKNYPGGSEPLEYPEKLRPWIDALSVSSTKLLQLENISPHS